MSANPSLARPARRARFRDRSGFTLIEVLVAFTVMAMLLSVLYRGVVTIRAGSAAFDDHTHLEIVARAVLEDALANRALANGTTRGLRDGRRWTIIAASIDLSAQLPPPAPDTTDRPTAVVAPNASPPGPEDAKPAEAKKPDSDPLWRPQRLIVRVETSGKPLEIETVRLVKAERRK